ncbi:MAG: cell division protein ZipA C-terminal FtsZ-binding domain-containing protein [Pseudomonadota bacterium]
MTDLQISLMALGSTIVVGVISYNKWQEYKAKKTVERAFADEHDDVLMTPDARRSTSPARGRTEPSFSSEAVGVAQVPAEKLGAGAGAEASIAAALAGVPMEGEPLSPRTDTLEEMAQPVVGATTFTQDQHPVATPAAVSASAAASVTTSIADDVEPPPKELPVDPMIDCAIPLALGANLRGEKVIGPIQALRHVGNKPVHFMGLREGGDWESIQHGAIYTALIAGVQLANRSSALNEIEFSELVTRLRQVSDELDAEPDVPNMKSVMQSAKALQQFVGQYDAQLSVNVQAKNAAWSIVTLLAALERQGFDVRPDGRLVMSDGDGGNLFTLSTNVTLAAESTTRLTLLLDVPCVAPDRDGFGAMTACARSLSHRLDGVVVDDSEQPLSDAALAEIADQVRNFYADMQAADIPAGSTRALRLFS